MLAIHPLTGWHFGRSYCLFTWSAIGIRESFIEVHPLATRTTDPSVMYVELTGKNGNMALPLPGDPTLLGLGPDEYTAS